MSHRVQLKVTPGSQGTEITIDGVRQAKVRRMSLSAEAGKTSVLTIERCGFEMDISGNVDQVVYGGQARPSVGCSRMPLRFNRPEGWSPYANRYD